MGNNSYNSLANVILMATLSASVVSLPFNFDSMIPKINHNYVCPNDIANWKDNAIIPSYEYQQFSNDEENLQIIIEFSRKVIDNTKDIDREFVDIVNDKFWDLI